MKPSEIVLSVPPLTATLGRSEREHAAALIVRACQQLGDRWQAVSPRQVGEAFRADFNAGREPFASLAVNPFFRPDFFDLAEKGFATMREDKSVELTEKALAAIAKWARPAEQEAPRG